METSADAFIGCVQIFFDRMPREVGQLFLQFIQNNIYVCTSLGFDFVDFIEDFHNSYNEKACHHWMSVVGSPTAARPV